MEEKTYLKWYNKVGYGTGDIAGNVVYAFLSSFVMIYLTNTVGLNSGIVGTLIAVSKLMNIRIILDRFLAIFDIHFLYFNTGRHTCTQIMHISTTQRWIEKINPSRLL